MVLLLGHSEDGRGQWEREGSSAGLWNECVPEKTTRGAKAVCLCMIQPFIISVFQNLGSGCFFRSPAFFSESGGKFCRIEVRHFFLPKGGSRYVKDCQSHGLPAWVLSCMKSIDIGRPMLHIRSSHLDRPTICSWDTLAAVLWPLGLGWLAVGGMKTQEHRKGPSEHEGSQEYSSCDMLLFLMPTCWASVKE